ncbi:MAG: hypothetical protein GXO25_01140 [Euryarchaeota archaeon]|nr:hypothetical protein [Euryarchaeota archaeon]
MRASEACKIVAALRLNAEQQCKMLHHAMLALLPILFILAAFTIIVILAAYTILTLAIIFVLVGASIALIVPVNREFEKISGWKLRVQESAFVILIAPFTALLILASFAIILTAYPWGAGSYPTLLTAALILVLGAIAVYIAQHNGFSILAEYEDAPERFVKLSKKFGAKGARNQFKYGALRIALKRIDGKDVIVIYRLTSERASKAREIMNYTDSL